MNRMIEKLAELEHKQWMSWAREIMRTEVISYERFVRWSRYMVPYDELPEDVKEADRRWAREVVKVIWEEIGVRVDCPYEEVKCEECGLDECEGI